MAGRRSVAPAPGGRPPAPSLVETTARRVRDEILGGTLEPGERLIEEQICQRFSISRAPLREAMRLLAQQGLVEHLPRRGVRVTTLSDVDVAELFEVRDLLERHAVRTMLPLRSRPGTDPLAEVKARLREMGQAQDAGDQLAKDDAHRAFHAAVVALAGNRQLDLALEPILLKLQRPMAVNLRREASLLGPGEGLARHRRLVDALETNDVGTVLAALRDHGARRYLDGAVAVTRPRPGSSPVGAPSRTWPAAVTSLRVADELWAVIEPVLPSSSGRRGRPWTDHRRTWEAIAWRHRTGSAWRDLPADFGLWQTVWDRHDRWSKDGTYRRMRDAALAAGLVDVARGDPLEQLLAVHGRDLPAGRDGISDN